MLRWHPDFCMAWKRPFTRSRTKRSGDVCARLMRIRAYESLSTNSWLGFATVEVRFHKRVQADLNEIMKKYSDISIRLGEDFFAEF